MMFGWYNPNGGVYARGTSFAFRYPFGQKILCRGDATVAQALRDFDACRYGGLSPGNAYCDWFGPSFGLPDIRTQEGWLGAEPGDPDGSASPMGPIEPTSAVVTPGASENDEDRRR